MKEIKLTAGQYQVDSYPSSGLYLNTIDNNVYFVDKTAFVALYLGAKGNVENALSDYKTESQSTAYAGISEDYSLKLVKTIISELKK